MAREQDGPASGERGTLRGHGSGLTRDRLEELFRHYADLGVDVEWRDLGSKRRGEYDWFVDKVVVSPRLDRRQLISTLAHELGHRRFGDRCSTPPGERRAWEYGAALIVTPDEYRRAEDQVGHHTAALAIDLDVTPKLIDAWRRWWETKGRLLEDQERARRGEDA